MPTLRYVLLHVHEVRISLQDYLRGPGSLDWSLLSPQRFLAKHEGSVQFHRESGFYVNQLELSKVLARRSQLGDLSNALLKDPLQPCFSFGTRSVDVTTSDSCVLVGGWK